MGPKFTVAGLIWAMLAGLAAVLFTVTGAWVAGAEHRMTRTEVKAVVLEERVNHLQRDVAEMKADLKAILELLRQRR